MEELAKKLFSAMPALKKIECSLENPELCSETRASTSMQSSAKRIHLFGSRISWQGFLCPWYAKATWLVAIPSAILCSTFPPVSVFEINTNTARTVSLTRDEPYMTLAFILQLHSIGLACLLSLFLCFIGLFFSPYPVIYYIFNLIMYLYLLSIKRIKDKIHYSK